MGDLFGTRRPFLIASICVCFESSTAVLLTSPMNHDFRRHAVHWLALLVFVDLLLISLYAAYGLGILHHSRFQLTAEWSLGESYQYLKEVWLVVLLLVLVIQTRSHAIAGWSLLFGYLLMDDCLQLHEIGGARLGQWLTHTFAMRERLAVAVGEMLYLIVMGIGLLSIVATAQERDKSEWSNHAKLFFPLTLLLAFFAIGMDAIHALLPRGVVHQLAGAIEDGGEQLVMSCLVAFTYCLHLIPKPLQVGRDHVPSMAYVPTERRVSGEEG